MDEYPQPRPVLYGTWEDEPPARTLTMPVRSGPPRYPPAPPLAGDAPDPFEPSRSGAFTAQRGTPSLQILPFLRFLYTVATGYSLILLFLGVGQIVELSEIMIGVFAIASSQWLSGRTYLFTLSLVALHVALGIVFAHWLSPALWVAGAILLYLLRSSIRKFYVLWARTELLHSKRRYPTWRSPHERKFPLITRLNPKEWRIRW